MQNFVNRLWYGKPNIGMQLLVWLLLPLSGLFYLVSRFRRLLFKLGIKKAHTLPVPVIVVGNITVGGSGKTPTVIYLIEMLRRHGYLPGVISRGYGVDFSGTREVLPGMSPTEVGDEPAMIVARTQVPMVIGRNRVEAAKALIASRDVNVIISDDGLQHYALNRDIELLVLDGERRFGNAYLLPSGPLREGIWRQKEVDFTLVNGESCRENEFLMQLEPGHWQRVQGSQTDELNSFSIDAESVAIAGIGNPQRFFNTLKQMDIHVDKQHAFDDHQAFLLEDIIAIAGEHQVLMTEKDAVKCREFAKQNWWYLPVDAKIDSRFEQQLIAQLQP
ncbi:tetraacyldisaccharide 4'-kinase [Shewanella mesophila]|uniref:tetraacyldisaccharide 4'-kinase n=1 Tax=Shewanella mesophila TaxID=2864208 RepID=UPI001C65EC0F|nr:tetraacyldisaccharide 4'-kinase [Shewanella mesophila]QYJ87563.1 tetraacyldisaccharide 4'-kinase [Shewanella mesophila]